MAEISVNMRAYCKILLHASKYPHRAVNGVLLAEDTKQKDHKSLRFVDCIPLFHLTLGLSPMLEAALLQIDGYCKSVGCVIAGYYQANEHYTDIDVNNIAKTVGRKLNENYPDSYIFMVDNRRISPEAVSEIYKVYTLKDTLWKESEKRRTVEEETLETAASLLSTGAYRELVDFDNHLDDITCDWRNLKINEIIGQLT